MTDLARLQRAHYLNWNSDKPDQDLIEEGLALVKAATSLGLVDEVVSRIDNFCNRKPYNKDDPDSTSIEAELLKVFGADLDL